MPDVSVIVPAWNAAETVGATVRALAAQDYEGSYEVIVIDNGSEDETARIAASVEGVRVITKEHSGPGEARNRGAAEARAPVLAFTDADCVPTADWLREGMKALAAADLVQGAVRPDPGAVRRPFDRTVWVDGRVPLYETANLFCRRDVFERLGGFEDWVDPAVGTRPFAEDIWLGWRARRSGARIAFAEGALVHHAVFAQSPGQYIAERLRLAYVPALVRRIPELRREFLLARLFLNRRTAAFDLAVLGALFGGVFRYALVLVVPYLWMLVRGAWRWRLRAPLALLTDLAADATAFAALVVGSVRARTPVL